MRPGYNALAYWKTATDKEKAVLRKLLRMFEEEQLSQGEALSVVGYAESIVRASGAMNKFTAHALDRFDS